MTCFQYGAGGGDERKPVRVTLTGIRLAKEEEEEEDRLLLIVEDLTEEQALRAAALESERRFRDLAETAHDGIIMTDPQGKIAYFNRAAERMFGYRRNQALERPIGTVLPEPLSCQLDEGLQHTPVWETQGLRQDGTFFMVEGSGSVFEGSSGRFITYVLRDLTERKQFERQLMHLANHDPLTNLPNRKFFQDRLGISLDEAALNGEQLAVLFLDLDRFKLINDTFGHALGDKLLLMVAERLAGCFRKGDDILARQGETNSWWCCRGFPGGRTLPLSPKRSWGPSLMPFNWKSMRSSSPPASASLSTLRTPSMRATSSGVPIAPCTKLRNKVWGISSTGPIWKICRRSGSPWRTACAGPWSVTSCGFTTSPRSISPAGP